MNPEHDAVDPSNLSPQNDPVANNPVQPPQSQPAEVITPQSDNQSVASPQPTLATTPQPTSQPPVTGAPMQSQPFSSQPPQPKKSFTPKRILLAVLLVFILASVAYVFAWYIPNQPKNVWRAGLERTGEAFEDMALKAVSSESQEVYKNMELTGSLEAKGEGFDIKGDINGKYDEARTDTGLNIKIESADGQDMDLSLNVMTELADDTRFPDTYFRISGFSNLGLDMFIPGINDMENKWIGVSSEFLESYLPEEVKEAGANKEEPTSEEISSFVNAVTGVTREYVFSADKDKAVLEMREYVGEESLDNDIRAKHYRVGINLENSERFCEAVTTAVLSHPTTSKLFDVSQDVLDKEKEKVSETCKVDDGSELKEATFDMWIDTKYKLIHKIRITDEDKPTNYVDFGQNFTGGDNIPMFIKFRDEESEQSLDFTLDVNSKDHTTKAQFDMEQKGNSGYTVKGNLEVKPHQGEVQINPPKDAIPLEDLLKQLGIPLGPSIDSQRQI